MRRLWVCYLRSESLGKNILKLLEREPLRYFKCDGKVIFTRPLLMLGKVTFDDHVNALERFWKGDISYIFTKP